MASCGILNILAEALVGKDKIILNYTDVVIKLSASLENIGAKMNIIIHFLFSHLDCPPVNLNVSDEHEKQFYQDIKEIKTQYQIHWDVVVRANYFWCVK